MAQEMTTTIRNALLPDQTYAELKITFTRHPFKTAPAIYTGPRALIVRGEDASADAERMFQHMIKNATNDILAQIVKSENIDDITQQVDFKYSETQKSGKQQYFRFCKNE